MRYTRRDIGKLALSALPAAAMLERPIAALAQTPRPNSTIERRAHRHDHLQLPKHAGPERGSDPQVHRRLGDQRGRVDGWTCGELRRRAAGRTRRRWPDGGEPPDARAAGRPARSRGPPEAWRTSVSMDRFKALRKMYNDAGVSIYAWKALNPKMSDEEFEYVFNVAEALGCTHTTLELPEDVAQLKRIGAFAEKQQGLRGVSHPPAGQHDRVRSRRSRPRRRTWRTSISATTSPADRREPDPVPAEVPRPHRQLPPEGSADAGARRGRTCHGAPATRR